jgi:hypothetical protein
MAGDAVADFVFDHRGGLAMTPVLLVAPQNPRVWTGANQFRENVGIEQVFHSMATGRPGDASRH